MVPYTTSMIYDRLHKMLAAKSAAHYQEGCMRYSCAVSERLYGCAVLLHTLDGHVDLPGGCAHGEAHRDADAAAHHQHAV